MDIEYYTSIFFVLLAHKLGWNLRVLTHVLKGLLPFKYRTCSDSMRTQAYSRWRKSYVLIPDENDEGKYILGEFEKVTVKEGSAVPFYDRLAAGAGGEYPGWNFHKYVVDRSGKVVASFGSRTKPDDAKLLALIDKLLGETPPGP